MKFFGRLVALAPLARAASRIDPSGFNDPRHHWRKPIPPGRFLPATGSDQPT